MLKGIISIVILFKGTLFHCCCWSIPAETCFHPSIFKLLIDNLVDSVNRAAHTGGLTWAMSQKHSERVLYSVLLKFSSHTYIKLSPLKSRALGAHWLWKNRTWRTDLFAEDWAISSNVKGMNALLSHKDILNIPTFFKISTQNLQLILKLKWLLRFMHQTQTQLTFNLHDLVMH